ncbi:DUF4240 domain-containing protein [Listeria weihenstephanensis]|uniref:DUF4240 domain-containing protein n=1 Tax=Listeria weihenstephanensis TaxID=1006155 RepID=A0A841Z7C1_9LIST|nr:DUF4240 domain-containing protein [Listeria weihenstephanensis]MBC1501175.1 DUF4240 domain-containing protein [Listeria weihenstephanensis]
MHKQKFWKIIHTCVKRSKGDIELYEEQLEKQLNKLTIDNLIKWQLIFDEYHELSKSERLWAAAHLLNDGASDDGFDYFRAWLISHGEDIFLKVVADPDTLGTLISADIEALDEDFLGEFEEIMYVASYVYAEKTGDDDDEQFFNACEQFALTDHEKKEISQDVKLPEALEWDEDSDLALIFPQIAALKGEDA